MCLDARRPAADARDRQRRERPHRARPRCRHQRADRRRRRHAHWLSRFRGAGATGLAVSSRIAGRLRAARRDHQRRRLLRLRRSPRGPLRHRGVSVRRSRRRVSFVRAVRSRASDRSGGQREAAADRDSSREVGVDLRGRRRRAWRAGTGRARDRVSSRDGRSCHAQPRCERCRHRRSRRLSHRPTPARWLHRWRRVDIDNAAGSIGHAV